MWHMMNDSRRRLAVRAISWSASAAVMLRRLNITTKWEQSVIWDWFQDWGRSSALIAGSVITRNFQGCRP